MFGFQPLSISYCPISSLPLGFESLLMKLFVWRWVTPFIFYVLLNLKSWWWVLFFLIYLPLSYFVSCPICVCSIFYSCFKNNIILWMFNDTLHRMSLFLNACFLVYMLSAPLLFLFRWFPFCSYLGNFSFLMESQLDVCTLDGATLSFELSMTPFLWSVFVWSIESSKDEENY